MNIFLDVDGVLAQFVEGACKKLGVKNPYLNRNNWGKYDLPSLLGMGSKQFWDSLDDIDFWANLEPYEWAEGLVDLCESYGDVYFLTSPMFGWKCPAGKAKWLDKYFPGYNRRWLIGAPKHLLANRDDAFLIDDSVQNVDRFTSYGGRSILFIQPWNNISHDIIASPKDRIKEILERVFN